MRRSALCAKRRASALARLAVRLAITTRAALSRLNATTAAAPAPTVDYRITPEFKDGALVALDVEMTGRGAHGGVDILDLPEKNARDNEENVHSIEQLRGTRRP